MFDLEYRKGMAFAVSAYLLWGIAPLYFALLDSVSAVEILLHRVLWSFVFVVGLMLAFGGFDSLKKILRQPKLLAVLALTSSLIAANWLLFIWSINNGYLLDASLGYFINPLFNVVLGMIFLQERLHKLQWVAVALSVTGVLIQLISFGSIPIISLGLAISFGLYGLLRKKVNVDSKTGLLVETMMLLPIALVYLWLSPATTTSNMFSNPWDLNLLLMMAGVVTTVPLLCFASAAIRIPLSLLGFFQYIGPSIMFVMAISLFGETFDAQKGITFGFIWLALLVFILDIWRRRQKPSAVVNTLAVKSCE